VCPHERLSAAQLQGKGFFRGDTRSAIRDQGEGAGGGEGLAALHAELRALKTALEAARTDPPGALLLQLERMRGASEAGQAKLSGQVSERRWRCCHPLIATLPSLCTPPPVHPLAPPIPHPQVRRLLEVVHEEIAGVRRSVRLNGENGEHTQALVTALLDSTTQLLTLGNLTLGAVEEAAM